jgi:integrase/recombinase XerD
MPNSHLLGSFVRRFLLESVIADRNLSRNTQTSYRDAIRLLLRFIAERYGIDPTHLTVEDVNAEEVRNFLTCLEKEHSSSSATVNQRLTAIRSPFRFVGQCVPELIDLATQVEAVPLRKTVLSTISYLEEKEMDAFFAFLATPDSTSTPFATFREGDRNVGIYAPGGPKMPREEKPNRARPSERR